MKKKSSTVLFNMTPINVNVAGFEPSYVEPGGILARRKESRPWQELLWIQICDYCEKTTLHGYRYLTEPGRHWVERLLWVIVQLLATWGVVFIILDVWKEYINSPTVTTVDSTNYPIWNVSFPAVAVCNINKISKKAAWNVAQRISKTNGVPPEELFKLMRYLGRLYDHENDNVGDMQRLQTLLAGRNRNKTFDVSSIMEELTPKCETLLVRCRWLGRVQNCSDLFTLRKTMEGFCCSFNYIRHSDDFDTETLKVPPNETEGKRVRSPGFHMGLTVLVDPEPEDYYYPLISSYGSKILVFNPRDFPDTPSGGLIEKLVPPKTEVFFRLEATTVFAVPNVQNFDWQQRGCLFPNELPKLFSGSYSYSDCLMNCRIRSIHTLCRCLPFYFPSRGSSKDCDMTDIPCLYKYREKWSTLRPTEEILGLESEMEESISCGECYPSCSDTSYHVQTAAAELSNRQYDISGFMNGVELRNHSVFHLFFGSKNSVRLKQDVLYYWYDLLSNFGGICGLFVGFSLISIVEFVYFFTLRLFFAMRAPQEKGSSREVQKQNIYWREIMPRQVQPRY